MTTKQYLYRYKDIWIGPSLLNISDIVLRLEQFEILKETPCGYWIKFWNGPKYKRFVLKEGTKRYALADKKDALESYYARKRKQLEILTAQCERAKLALNLTLDSPGFEDSTKDDWPFN